MLTEDERVRTQHMTSVGGPAEYSIQVPYFSVDDESVMLNINKAVYEIIIAPLDLFAFNPGTERVEIEYEVTHVGDTFISIHFFGFVGGWRGTSDIQKTITVSLETGNVLAIGDFFPQKALK